MTHYQTLAFTLLFAAGAALPLTPASATPLDYTPISLSGGGAVSASSFSSTGHGSARLSTPAGGRTGIVFGVAPGTPLGTLGDLDQLGFSFYLEPEPDNTTAPNAGFAVRLWTNAFGTEALVWEGVNQGGSNNPNTREEWVYADIIDGLFWQRANGENFDTGGNFVSLDAWLDGHTPSGGIALDSSTNIYAVEISFGSGIQGDFVGYVDQLNIGFGSVTYTDNFVPEPSTYALSLSALAALFLVVQRRRRASRASA